MAVALAALALAGAGALLAASMFTAAGDRVALRRDAAVALRSPAAVGQDVPTSFGVVAVENVTRSTGPTARALAGVTHGIQSLVAPNRIQVSASVTITNLRPTVLPFTPAQFQLYATRRGRPGASDRPIRIARSSVAAGTLQPDASIDATITFVAPRNGSRLWMSFRDRDAATPVLIDLGRTDRTPAGALDRHHVHHR
jgi:hypothetical protein